MLVADQRRRNLIRYLRHDTTGQASIDEIVTWLQQVESIPDGKQSPDRKHITIQLHHTHLPKLADHDIVEYESETGTVRYHPNEQIEAILDGLPEHGPQAQT